MNYLKLLMILLLPGVLLGSNISITNSNAEIAEYTCQKTSNYQVLTQVELSSGNISSSPNFHLVSFTDLIKTKRDLIRNTTVNESSLSKIVEENNLPKEFSLSHNYPNPFNSSTKIDYALPKPTQVSIDIYDVLGRRVKTIVNEHQNAGHHSVTFSSSSLATGIYIYRIQTLDFSKAHKMLIVK